jgi:ribosomal protein S18 acetylase RimI-like enzyme
MNVRTLRTDDLDAAFVLWEATEHLGRVPREEVESVMAFDGDLVLAAEHDGQLVGVVLGSYDGRRGWIQRLAVEPAHRRSGVARSLIDELERRLVERGCRQVNLLVFDHNIVGRSFWEGLGYEGTEQLVMYRRRLDDDVPAAYPTGGGVRHAARDTPGEPDLC